MVRQLSIDQLDNEGRRVSIYEKGSDRTPIFTPNNLMSPVRGEGCDLSPVCCKC